MNAPAGTLFARALSDRLHLGDRRRALERRVIPGADAEQDDVIVVVDEAGDDGAAAKIDLTRARTQSLIATRTDGGESSILNGDLCCRGPAPIHRDEPAVGQMQVARAGAGIGGRLPRLAERRDWRECDCGKDHSCATEDDEASESEHAGDCMRRGRTGRRETSETPNLQLPTPKNRRTVWELGIGSWELRLRGRRRRRIGRREDRRLLARQPLIEVLQRRVELARCRRCCDAAFTSFSKSR